MEEPRSAGFESVTSHPAPPQKGNKKYLLAALAAVLLCCLCLALVVAGFAAYRAFGSDLFGKDVQPKPVEVTVAVIPQETPALKSTPVAPQPAAPQPPAAGGGLGVSRAEMVDFFGSGGAFEFEAPFTAQGKEVVMGSHTWLCLEGDCAAITLLGAEDDLEAVSIAVPTDPNDDTQSMTAITLLMTLASHFSSSSSTVPFDVLDAVTSAQASRQNKEVTFKDNGYTFNVSYDAASRVAALAVSR